MANTRIHKSWSTPYSIVNSTVCGRTDRASLHCSANTPPASITDWFTFGRCRDARCVRPPLSGENSSENSTVCGRTDRASLHCSANIPPASITDWFTFGRCRDARRVRPPLSGENSSENSSVCGLTNRASLHCIANIPLESITNCPYWDDVGTHGSCVRHNKMQTQSHASLHYDANITNYSHI